MMIATRNTRKTTHLCDVMTCIQPVGSPFAPEAGSVPSAGAPGPCVTPDMWGVIRIYLSMLGGGDILSTHLLSGYLVGKVKKSSRSMKS